MGGLTAYGLVFLVSASGTGGLPVHGLTSGALNPQVTQGDISLTICVAGWTATVRPPAAYTSGLKRKQLADARYGDSDRNPSHYEEDHLISLELGGDPRSVKNLWPEPYAGQWNARVKDRLEDRLHKLVCARKVSLADAQKAIAGNWIAAYKKFMNEKP